jgi:hypothetical protein
MSNTFKEAANTSPAENSGNKSVFAMIEKTFKMDGMFNEGVPVQFLPYILWVTVLVVLYIANAHYTEKTIRKIDKMKYEVEDLRTEYTTLKASYMFQSKQSEIAKKVSVFGLEESKKPPVRLKIDN